MLCVCGGGGPVSVVSAAPLYIPGYDIGITVILRTFSVSP